MNRAIVLAVSLALVLSLASAVAFSAAQNQKKAAAPKDPVCGMEVDAAKAVKLEHKGKTYYFCSDHCKREFEKDPAKHTGKKS